MQTAYPPPGDPGGLASILAGSLTERGTPLLELVDRGTVLLVFLRHFGCSYCRQAISDVAQIKSELSANSVQPVFVHLGTPERARPYFEYYGLAEVERVSDPEAVLYRSAPFALPRQHPLRHFLVPKNWKSWLTSGIRKYGIGMIHEDSYQMPGIFVLRAGMVVNAFHFKTIADQPDYLEMVGLGSNPR